MSRCVNSVLVCYRNLAMEVGGEVCSQILCLPGRQFTKDERQEFLGHRFGKMADLRTKALQTGSRLGVNPLEMGRVLDHIADCSFAAAFPLPPSDDIDQIDNALGELEKALKPLDDILAIAGIPRKDIRNAKAKTRRRKRLRPRWDEMKATLFWGDVPIRVFSHHPAKNQRDIIEAFHREDWNHTVPTPFKDNNGSDAKKLNLAIYHLNHSLLKKAIRFRGDGTGDGVMWEPVD